MVISTLIRPPRFPERIPVGIGGVKGGGCQDILYGYGLWIRESPSPKQPNIIRFVRKPSILGTWNSWWKYMCHGQKSRFIGDVQLIPPLIIGILIYIYNEAIFAPLLLLGLMRWPSPIILGNVMGVDRPCPKYPDPSKVPILRTPKHPWRNTGLFTPPLVRVLGDP